jgi:hypothetical protein
MTELLPGLVDEVGVGVGVGVDDGVAVGEGLGVAVGFGVGVGFGFAIATPLLQTSFFPLFMQVYFLPWYVMVCAAFLQTDPAFTTAPLEGAGNNKSPKEIRAIRWTLNRISKD